MGIPESDSAHETEIESDNGSAYEFGNEFCEFMEFESEEDYIEFLCLLFFSDRYESSYKLEKKLFFGTICNSYHYGDASKQMGIMLYPKVAIVEIYRSNQFTSLQGSFLALNKNCKVLKCGFQPIYAYDPMVKTRDVDVSYSDCQRNVENKKLCLNGHPNPINQLSCIPTIAANVVNTLYLRDCKNLDSLPSNIWDQFNSLKSLFCSNYSQLRTFHKS